MPKLLQINICLNLSTGKIAQAIGEKAIAHGWESWIAYSGRTDDNVPSKSHVIRVGNFADACMHYAHQRLFDEEGLHSSYYTKKLIREIDKIQPDIIHLHNIHDHWLKYPLLFKYIAERKIPVVWTQHDCWSFTGGCTYFDMTACEQWKHGCKDCPEKRGLIIKNRSGYQFRLKKELLDTIPSLTFVPVSDWLADMMRESCQKHRDIITIHNGTDISKFKPVAKKDNSDKYKIIGVASTWSERKGLDDFVKLRAMLPDDYQITLVGLSEKQKESLPDGIIGLTRTSTVEDLVQLYSDADVFVNPTYSDNFPTTNIEALACGTPVITYKTGGSPEAIDEKTGVVVEQGNTEELSINIMNMHEHPLSRDDCRSRAEMLYDKDKCFEKYIQMYNSLVINKIGGR